eukprot:2405099-Pleurochrysis_carterae.AAC.2
MLAASPHFAGRDGSKEPPRAAVTRARSSRHSLAAVRSAGAESANISAVAAAGLPAALAMAVVRLSLPAIAASNSFTTPAVSSSSAPLGRSSAKGSPPTAHRR